MMASGASLPRQRAGVVAARAPLEPMKDRPEGRGAVSRRRRKIVQVDEIAIWGAPGLAIEGDRCSWRDERRPDGLSVGTRQPGGRPIRGGAQCSMAPEGAAGGDSEAPAGAAWWISRRQPRGPLT
jgi:hypothetical protein